MDRSRNEPPPRGGADAPISWSRDRSPPGGELGGSRWTPGHEVVAAPSAPIGCPHRCGSGTRRTETVRWRRRSVGSRGRPTPGRRPIGRVGLPSGRIFLGEAGGPRRSERGSPPPLWERLGSAGRSGSEVAARCHGRPVAFGNRCGPPPPATPPSAPPANHGTSAPPAEPLPAAWIFPRAGPPAPADRERKVRRAGPTAGIVERGEERSPGGSPPRSSAALDGSWG